MTSSSNTVATVPFTVSVVVPAYNEQEVLPEFHRHLAAALDRIPAVAEVIYVNDGSSDSTVAVIQALQAHDSRVALIDLSRNFGKEIALTAGIDHACGDAVIVIDADLQDPPELITTLIEYWQKGYDVVYARRIARQGETWLKKLTAYVFYRLIQHVNRVKIPEDTGDFRLLSRRAVDALCQLRERHRFMKGLFAWIGFPQIAVPYCRDSRFAGKTKWNYWSLWNFAIDGITSFTIAPLKVASYVGFFISFSAFLYGIWIVLKTLIFGESVQGYPSLMTIMLLLGGLQLLFIGIVGEYLGRMFDETKGRPLYLINAYQPSALQSAGQTATVQVVGTNKPN